MSTIENTIVESDTPNDVVVEAEIPANPDVVEAENPDVVEDRPGREAARYRRQLREVEAERDALVGQLDALRRAEVDAVVKGAGRMASSQIIYAAGTALGDLLADDGTVDATKVLTALDRAGEALGVRVRVPVAPRGDWQGNVGVPIPWGEPEKKFETAFRPRRP